jgi:hypothetical protein
VERRTAITEAEKRPAKTYMRFSEGRAWNKSSELLAGYEE